MIGTSKKTSSGTFEGLLVPNTHIKSKSIEVSIQALNFSFTSITPGSNSKVNCLSCPADPPESKSISAIAHSPSVVMMKILRGPILTIFWLDKLTWIFRPPDELLSSSLFGFELPLITVFGKLKHCVWRGDWVVEAIEYCIEEDTSSKSVKKQTTRTWV